MMALGEGAGEVGEGGADMGKGVRLSIRAAGANVPVGGRHVPVAAVPAALELVEDAVVLIQRAEFTAKVFMNLKQTRVLTREFSSAQTSSPQAFAKCPLSNQPCCTSTETIPNMICTYNLTYRGALTM